MHMESFAAYLLVGIVIVLIGILSIREGSQKKSRGVRREKVVRCFCP